MHPVVDFVNKKSFEEVLEISDISFLYVSTSEIRRSLLLCMRIALCYTVLYETVSNKTRRYDTIWQTYEKIWTIQKSKCNFVKEKFARGILA